MLVQEDGLKAAHTLFLTENVTFRSLQEACIYAVHKDIQLSIQE